MRANKDLANLFDWAAAWMETGDAYYRDMIKNAVEIPNEQEGRFAVICRMHFVEFPQDAHYHNKFVGAVQEWKAQYPKLVG